MNLYVKEEVVAREKENDEGEIVYESEVYESAYEDVGELFRACRREYGRCISKVYIDRNDGTSQAIGWVFLKRVPYQDAPNETYLQEAWITVHKAPPTRTIKYHYFPIEGRRRSA